MPVLYVPMMGALAWPPGVSRQRLALGYPAGRRF